MQGELLQALIAGCEADLESKRLVDAESKLEAALELSGDEPALAELSAALESAIVQAQSDTVLPVQELTPLEIIPARYPLTARRRDITGWVEVQFTVTPTGQTADVEVARAEPEIVFDRSAVEAVEQWLFEPKEFRGQVISQRAVARLVFRLE